jgi:hypothetical protein
MEIRENGIGSNFRVISPADGFRKDNRLWFGTCSVCSERVINSSFRGVWEHTLKTETSNPNHYSFRYIDSCPSA